jgi:hypothetical protein
MKTELNKLSPLARRDFIMRTAQTALGVTVMPALNLRAAAAAPGPGYGKAKKVIFLWMNGGMTHIDTWDPKTGETKGPTGSHQGQRAASTSSAAPWTNMAKVSDKITIIRSMSSKTGVHDAGTYIMKTGYEPRGTIVHPCLGAWASHFHGRIKGVTLPDSVDRQQRQRLPRAPVSSRRRTSPIPISNPADRPAEHSARLQMKLPVPEARCPS